MNGATHRFTCRGALAGVLAMVAVACAPAPASSPTPAAPKATEAPRSVATVEPQPTTPSTEKPASKPEGSSLRLGLPVNLAFYLPFYLAAERTAQEEGLNLEVLTLTGGPAVAQAVASDSLDVGMVGLTQVIDAIKAGHRGKSFYVGFGQAELEWFTRPEIKSWADLKGKSIGVNSYGSTPDIFTRHALSRHGLEPGREVQLVQAGGSPAALQALKAGQLDAAVLGAPFKWQAEAEGFTRLGTEATEVAEEWPKTIFLAKETFLDDHPQTVRALLRAYVKAIRLAKADREFAVQTMMRVVKYERPYAERAYDEIVPALNERGTLPTKSMPVFWEISVAAGDVTEPWPESRLLDRRFIDTFDEWAPR